MSEPGRIEVRPRTMTDDEWVEAISLAMKVDLDYSLRRRVVEELLTIRQQRKIAHAAMADMYSIPVENTT